MKIFTFMMLPVTRYSKSICRVMRVAGKCSSANGKKNILHKDSSEFARLESMITKWKKANIILFLFHA